MPRVSCHAPSIEPLRPLLGDMGQADPGALWLIYPSGCKRAAATLHATRRSRAPPGGTGRREGRRLTRGVRKAGGRTMYAHTDVDTATVARVQK